MTEATAAGFSAEDAVRTLDELKGYEETLAARTAGITILVWAFVVAGIPLSYQGLAWWLSQQGTWGNVANALLWAPWIAAGMTATVALWRTHSISIRSEDSSSKDWLTGIGFTVLFFLIAGGLLLVMGSDANTFSIMGVATGLLTLAIATVNHLRFKHGSFWSPLYVAGVVILATGTALIITGADRDLAAFTTAFVQGISYFLAGIIMVARG